jgi:hypothetical protein
MILSPSSADHVCARSHPSKLLADGSPGDLLIAPVASDHPLFEAIHRYGD